MVAIISPCNDFWLLVALYVSPGIEGLDYLKSHLDVDFAIRFDMVNEEWQDPKEALAIWPILRVLYSSPPWDLQID